MKPCIVIPNYNHGAHLQDLINKLAPVNLPCIIVDDGSNNVTKQQLKKISELFPWVHLITLATNQGKGAAVIAGLKYAAAQHYSHAIQIDADGQHNPDDIGKFLTAIKKDPQALILGQPIYGPSVPKSRLYGRLITNFWVGIETLSCSMPDAMCGYRAYALAKTMPIIYKYQTNKKMAFDIEIIVRLYWAGVNIISIPTKVIYPPNNVSHFRLGKDNLEISWLHTRLFFGMLRRIPILLARKHNNHWSQIKEKGSLLGMKIVLYSYKILGRRLTNLLLYPIVAYFYCTSYNAKKASQEYLAKLANHGKKYSSFKHFLSFADSVLDKLAVWNNDIAMTNVDFPNQELLHNQVQKKQGGIIFIAHLGNIEIARALAKYDPNVKLNILVFHQNAKKINAFLAKLNNQFTLNMIYLDTISIPLVMQLQEKVAAGEFIAIACDRTSITQPHRNIKAKFFNYDACFPEGPFIMAGLLHCPVYSLFCFKQRSQSFKIIFEEFASAIDMQKNNRKKQLEYYAQKYADLLAYYCRQYPLQWFNFFDFWKTYEQ